MRPFSLTWLKIERKMTATFSGFWHWKFLIHWLDYYRWWGLTVPRYSRGKAFGPKPDIESWLRPSIEVNWDLQIEVDWETFNWGRLRPSMKVDWDRQSNLIEVFNWGRLRPSMKVDWDRQSNLTEVFNWGRPRPSMKVDWDLQWNLIETFNLA